MHGLNTCYASVKNTDMKHGEHYEENGQEYMDDHINGVDWHIPDNSEPIINDDGSWNDNPREKYSWEE
jgi:uncharacterized protein (UPF0128 family)